MSYMTEARALAAGVGGRSGVRNVCTNAYTNTHKRVREVVFVCV